MSTEAKEQPSSAGPTASCHCGAITLTLPTAPDRLNECHCSVCYKYGALWAYYARHKVVIAASPDAASQAPYVREDMDTKGALEFHRCGRCGCVMYWGPTPELAAKWKEQDQTVRMGVNCRMLPEEEIAGVERVVTRC